MTTLQPLPSGADAAHPPIIHEPERASLKRRIISAVLTVLAWSGYAYLVLPVLTTLAWALGLRHAALELQVPLPGTEGSPGALLPLLAGTFSLLLLAWGEYNRRRFSGLDRRQPVAPVRRPVVARALGATPALADAVREAMDRGQVITLHMDEHGVPKGFTPDAPGASALGRAAAARAAQQAAA